jgi:hypothetical protein
MTMETTTATMIDDNSNNKDDADDNGDNGNDHNGNNDKATRTRPQQQDHDNDTMTRYNNQLNGGPLAVDCDDDDDDDGDSDGNSNGDCEGDGDGEGNGGSTRCNDNNNDNNNNPLPVVINVVVIQRLCLCRTVTMTAAAGWQGGSCHWLGGDGNSDSACCNNDDIDHYDNHPMPVVINVFVIGRLSLCGARLTTAVGRRRGSGRQQNGEDSGQQGRTRWCHSLRQQSQPSLPHCCGRCHHLAPLSLQQWNDEGCGGTAVRG